MVKKSLVIISFFGILILTSLGCGRQSDIRNLKYVDIYSVVKEAFLTDKGYTDELAKYMTQEVFTKTNIYNTYPVNELQYKKPLKVDFNLKELSQKKENKIVYVSMIYSVMIKDSNDKMIGGSQDISIVFTVQNNGNGWYIIHKDEKA